MTVVCCIGASATAIGMIVPAGCDSASEGEAAEGAMEGDETLRRLRGLPSVVRWDTSLWGMAVRVCKSRRRCSTVLEHEVHR
jgi:hypothetical protein